MNNLRNYLADSPRLKWGLIGVFCSVPLLFTPVGFLYGMIILKILKSGTGDSSILFNHGKMTDFGYEFSALGMICFAVLYILPFSVTGALIGSGIERRKAAHRLK